MSKKNDGEEKLNKKKQKKKLKKKVFSNNYEDKKSLKNRFKNIKDYIRKNSKYFSKGFLFISVILFFIIIYVGYLLDSSTKVETEPSNQNFDGEFIIKKYEQKSTKFEIDTDDLQITLRDLSSNLSISFIQDAELSANEIFVIDKKNNSVIKSFISQNIRSIGSFVTFKTENISIFIDISSNKKVECYKDISRSYFLKINHDNTFSNLQIFEEFYAPIIITKSDNFDISGYKVDFTNYNVLIKEFYFLELNFSYLIIEDFKTYEIEFSGEISEASFNGIIGKLKIGDESDYKEIIGLRDLTISLSNKFVSVIIFDGDIHSINLASGPCKAYLDDECITMKEVHNYWYYRIDTLKTLLTVLLSLFAISFTLCFRLNINKK